MLKCRWIENGETIEGFVLQFVVNNENYVFAVAVPANGNNRIRMLKVDEVDVFPPKKRK